MGSSKFSIIGAAVFLIVFCSVWLSPMESSGSGGGAPKGASPTHTAESAAAPVSSSKQAKLPIALVEEGENPSAVHETISRAKASDKKSRKDVQFKSITNVCRRASSSASSKEPSAGDESGADADRQQQQPPWIPQCPPPSIVAAQSSNKDNEIDRQSDWVQKKYTYYAGRCNKTKGMMWKKLSREAHDKIANKVLDLFGVSTEASDEGGIDSKKREVVRVFDWACGCGVSLKYFADYFESGGSDGGKENNKMHPRFQGLGIDLIPGAIAYANQTFASSSDSLLFCQGDGTKLGWIPSNSYDFLTSFGGLLHLPSEFMCSTIEHLVRIVKPGGMIWAGYIDNKETQELLRGCRVECGGGSGEGKKIRVLSKVIDENSWLKGVGVPSANRKRKPVSLVWEKVFE